MATRINSSLLLKPERFCNQCDIESWFGQFELFLQLSSITADDRKRDFLLSYVDLPIYNSITSALKVSTASYDDAKNFLKSRYSTLDVYLERIDFFTAKFALPAEGFASKLNDYVDRFDDDFSHFKEQLLVAKFIASAPKEFEKELRLRRPSTLNACVEICNSMPLHSYSPVSAVNSQCARNEMLSNFRNTRNKVCFRCGSENHVASFPSCPAKDATCRGCQIKGHFQKMCKSKKKVHVQPTRVSSITSSKICSVSRPSISLQLNADRFADVIVDTGSEVSILSRAACAHCNLKILPNDSLLPFSNFDESPLYMYGKTEPLHVMFNGKSATVSFYVSNASQSVLGIDAISALRLVISYKENSDSLRGCDRVGDQSVHVAKCDSAAKIRMLPTAPPSVVQRVRRLPFTLEEKVEKELRQMIADDVIEEVVSSPYVSPIVVVPKKNNEIRICVDYRKINPHILPDPYPIPAVDDLLAHLNRPCVFSLIDLKAAYHQVPIDEASRDITGFVTHMGIFRFKKLPFGLACSPGLFVRTVHSVLKDIRNVLIYFDDLLIFGHTQEEHDSALKRVMDALKAANFTINAEKSRFNVREIEFLGRKLNSEGIQPPSEALRAIRDLSVPTTKKEMHSFLGLVSYFRSFVPNFVDRTAPLYRLLKENVPFETTNDVLTSISGIKDAILNSTVLGYFDTSLGTETVLTTDASRSGIGGMLSQVQNGVETPIYFVSRTLNSAEKNYSVPELETLAVVWCVERLSQYLFGRHFRIRTDHSSLRQVLTGNLTNSVLSARVTRWAMKMMPYSFSVEFVKGAQNVVADCLSRMPMANNDPDQVMEQSVFCISALPVSLHDIRELTVNDELLSEMRTYIVSKWPESKNALPERLQPYFCMRDSFSLQDGIIMRGEKIVVPEQLQGRLIDLAHEYHFGITKTKMRLRNSYWWLGMDKDVDNAVRKCYCFRNIVRDSPVQITEWETKPWYHLAIDIAGPKTDAQGRQFYILAAIDIHSKYVTARVLPFVKSSDVIDFLMSIFMTFGFCAKLTSDNGTQFTSAAFTDFLRSHGISHMRSSVYNPQANGQIERVNRNLKKLIENVREEEVPYMEIDRYLQKYLFAYNNTTHDTLSECPSQMLMNYTPRTYITPTVIQNQARQELIKQKTEVIREKIEKRALYANERRRPRTDEWLKIGDWVQKPPGPIRRIVEKVGPYTFKLNDGFTVNARKLVLIKRPSGKEYVSTVPDDEQSDACDRYPKRRTYEPERYGFS